MAGRLPHPTTSRLILEPLEVEKHLEDFHEIWNNAEAVIWFAGPPMQTIEESKTFMESILRNEKNPEIDKFAIILKSSSEDNGNSPNPQLSKEASTQVTKPKMVGMVGTNRQSPQGMEVGYCLNIKYWGHGYATEAFGAFLSWFWEVEERKNIPHLVAKVSPGNKASQRVLEKCGGKRGEILKDNYARYVDGGAKSDAWCFVFERPGGGVSS